MVSTHFFMSTVHLILIFLFSLLATASYLQLIQPVSCTKSLVFRCLEMEREALLSFKEGLIDPSGRLLSWVGDDCCNWTGVDCDNNTGHVIKLDLKNSLPVILFDSIDQDGKFTSYSAYEYYRDHEVRKAYNKSCLGGKISRSLLNLKHLSYLDLSLNNFSGKGIPKFLGSIESLKYLNLSFSFFAGVVPSQLGNLSRLQYLDLHLYSSSFLIDSFFHFPKLEVKSLEWFVGFPYLRYLNLGGLYLVKVQNWLPAVNMLPSLVELHLLGCDLTSFPHSISSINFTLLSVLDLSYNDFNSLIPQWLSNVSGLSTINLASNGLRGDIPVGLRHLTNLRCLNLAVNNLIGKILNSFANLCNLQTFDLHFSNISGEIIEFVDGLSQCSNSSLEFLDLSENGLLRGNLPYSLGGLKKLKTIDLFQSSVSGSIPNSIGNLSSLQTLVLFSSSVSGSILDSIENLSSLQTLDFSRISVSGSIPNSIGNLSSLQILNLSYNQMNGTISESIGKLSMLISLMLGWNSWEDILTEAHFQNLTRLKDLSLFVESSAIGTMILNVKQDWVPPFKLRSISLANMHRPKLSNVAKNTK